MKSAHSSIFQSPEIRIVEASAGSGKTFALAKRYVQLLLILSAKEVKALRHILAVTFTNKASFEMKERILEFLKKTAFQQLKPAEYEQIIKPLGWDAKEASARAAVVMEEILANYNYFQVETIDKFINAILSASAFHIGLTAQFRIRTRPEEYLQMSLDRMIDRAANDPDTYRLFEDFLQHYLYLENRSGWFPKKDILEMLRGLFDLHNTYGIDLGYDAFSTDAVIRKKSSVLKELRRIRDELPEGIHKRFRDSLDNFLDKHPRGFDLDDVPDGFARPELPANKGVEVPRHLEKLWLDIYRDLQGLCEEEAMGLFSPYVEIFEKIDADFQDVCARADIVFLAELNRKAAQLFADNVMTLEEIYARLASRFRHYLMDEFQDTSRLQWANVKPMAEEALSSGGTLFYVGDRKQAIYSFRGGDSRLFDDARAELAQYPVQKETLTSNWRSCEEVIAFNNAIFSADNLQNFLRTKEIEQKKTVMFMPEDTNYLLSAFESAHQVNGSGRAGGYVEVCLIDAPNKAERDDMTRERLVPLVKDLLKRFAPHEIAVLSRNNKEVEAVTHWLMEEGITVRSDRTSDIRQHPLITELVRFLTFLNSPIDDAAFAGFITGELFAKASGVPSETWHRFVFDRHCRSKKESVSYLYIEFRQAHPDVWSKLIEPFFKNVGLYPLYELTASIYHAFECLEHFSDDHGYLMRFLDLVKNQEDEYSDLASFLDYYGKIEGDDVFVTSVDEHAVAVMTIHKAKGLEFAAVILPSLIMDIQPASGGEGRPAFVPWKKDDHLHLLRLKSRYYKFSEKLNAIYESEYKKALLSELNTVYVALTRAKEEMYVMIPSKAGNSFNPVRWLLCNNEKAPFLGATDIEKGPELASGVIYEEMFKRGRPSERTPEIKSGSGVMFLSPSCDQDWVRFLKDEFTSEEDMLRREARQRGGMIHQLLACVTDLSSQTEDEIRKLWKETLEISGVDEAQQKDYTEMVSRILKDQTLTKFFYLSGELPLTPSLKTRGGIVERRKILPLFTNPPSEDLEGVGGSSIKVMNEFEIVNRFGDTRRIDRLMIKDNEVWIIDYKLGRDRMEQDRRQVEDYKALASEIYKEKAVKGFLVYLGDNVDVVEL